MIRHLTYLGLVLLLAAPLASAEGLPVYVSADPALPGSSCDACAGLDVSAGTRPPPGCMDCPSNHAFAGAFGSADGAGAYAGYCRGGFFWICPFAGGASAGPGGRHGVGLTVYYCPAAGPCRALQV